MTRENVGIVRRGFGCNWVAGVLGCQKVSSPSIHCPAHLRVLALTAKHAGRTMYLNFDVVAEKLPNLMSSAQVLKNTLIRVIPAMTFQLLVFMPW